jgi:hypothetical protein
VDIEQPHPIEQPAQPDGISVTFKHTEEDLLRFQKFSMWKVPRIRKRNLLRLVAIPLMLIVLYTLMGMEAVISVPVTVALTLVWVAYFFWRARSMTLKAARDIPYFYEKQSITVTPRGIEQIYEGGESVTNWKAVHEIVDSGEQILFYSTPKIASFVSYKAFSNESEARRFLELAQSWWQEARNRPSSSNYL